MVFESPKGPGLQSAYWFDVESTAVATNPGSQLVPPEQAPLQRAYEGSFPQISVPQ